MNNDRAQTPPARSQRPSRRRGVLGWAARFLAVLLLASVGVVLAYRILPPPITILMIERLSLGQGLHKSWRPLDHISLALPQAVIAGEDVGFCDHHGFDLQAMRLAARNNQRHPSRLRGGSTLSQQTAKNVFLWPSRDYVRKALEAWFTILEEALWGKRRILEVYLNVVEWGPGVYGAEAAAERYFHEDASALDPDQAARLAAILPSPLRWRPVDPGAYVRRRSSHIGAAAATVRHNDLAWCVRR